MGSDPHAHFGLSPAGESRKAAIRADLLARANDERRGRRILISTGAVALPLLAVALVLIARSGSTVPERGPKVVEKPIAPSAPTAAIPSDLGSEVRITIVRNEPLPSEPCGTASPAPRSGIDVCVLSDSQLLNVLQQTGESYGMVKVGGKTMVVSNTIKP